MQKTYCTAWEKCIKDYFSEHMSKKLILLFQLKGFYELHNRYVSIANIHFASQKVC